MLAIRMTASGLAQHSQTFISPSMKKKKEKWKISAWQKSSSVNLITTETVHAIFITTIIVITVVSNLCASAHVKVYVRVCVRARVLRVWIHTKVISTSVKHVWQSSLFFPCREENLAQIVFSQWHKVCTPIMVYSLFIIFASLYRPKEKKRKEEKTKEKMNFFKPPSSGNLPGHK